jgi:MFS family permease
MIASVLRNTWPLFLGMAFLMLGNGLQGTLVSWRATYEGFSPSVTGWIMTGYYAGFLAGSLFTPYLINGVGYIRVFAALASLASTAVLIQILFINPETWFAMRLLTGFCFAGTYVIVESWLNAASDNKSRGQMLSFYMLISFGGMAGGQWLLKLAHPSGFTLFVLSSILLSLALVPILIRRVETPEVTSGARISILELMRISPAGVFTIFISAIATGSMFAMGAVFAVKTGMTVTNTAIFMSSFIAAGALAQWPLGWLSDQIDRRIVIFGSGFIAAILCVVLLQLSPQQAVFYIVFAALGFFALPMYSIAVAHTNDRLNPEQMTGASSTIVLILGIGSLLGPILAGYLLTTFGPSGYLLQLGVINFLIALGMIYFIIQREAVAQEDQTHYQAVPPRSTGVAMEAVAHEAEESLETEAPADNQPE